MDERISAERALLLQFQIAIRSTTASQNFGRASSAATIPNRFPTDNLLDN